MKTFMLVGDVSDNAGPSNVHRELMEHWPEGDQLLVPSWSNPFLKVATTILSACRCEVLLTTGAGKLGSLATMIARHRGVPVVVLVHGYLPYENEINSLGLSDLVIERWRKVLLDADLVATNSEFHAGCLREAEPEIATRVRWFNLGIEPFSQYPHKEHGGGVSVAVSGGTRPIKGNEVVARAVSMLQGQGYQVDLSVFGRSYSENQELEKELQKCGGRMMGQVSQEEFADALSATDVFVMNSRRDSFGLSAIDALRGGASLLLSRNCGIAGVLALEDGDVISDCEDAQEVAEKIERVISSPNAGRIFEALDFDALGWDVSASRLNGICREAVELGRD